MSEVIERERELKVIKKDPIRDQELQCAYYNIDNKRKQ